jgi:chemotaxis protein MotA
MRVLSMVAVPCACAVVVVSYVWGGGAARALLHGAAALMVLGGTGAATLVSHSVYDIGRAMRAALSSFLREDTDIGFLTTRLNDWAIRAHRHGVMVLDAELDEVNDPFLRHALSLAVDGVEPSVLRSVLGAEARAREAQDDVHVRVLESAAGYAPTFGMLGAVLGLMQVMSSLDQPGRLGGGIATAFVATVYGLGLANVLLLPLAGRLRERMLAGIRRREIVVEAVIGLRLRTHPRLFAATMRGIAPESREWNAVGLPTAPMPSPAVGRPS